MVHLQFECGVAASNQNTQWDLIIGYYDMLLSINPSPVIKLNRAIAVGMHEGPKAALAIIERLKEKFKTGFLPYNLFSPGGIFQKAWPEG